ncbi:MAG: GNAT family N-acetyltransferase [Verrucomicrobia bacterium]|nr:GNAT family N-acetyltransferase [Verrucomicrobiota bacterium]
MFSLETPRLRLRELEPGDAGLVLELVNEPAWKRFIGDRGIRTLDDAQSYIRTGPRAMYERFGFGLWLVEAKDNLATPLGICGLLKREGLDDVDLGFALLERYWGRGYAFEAAAAALAYGRDRLKLPRIVAITSPDNERSGRLLEKLGFRHDRMIRLAADKPESRLHVSVSDGGAA